MATWRVEETPGGLRLAPVTMRGLGSEEMTWADLLYRQVSSVKVYALYFPTRFDLGVDTVATEALRAFGAHTGAGTSVNFWDPADAEFGRALALFDLTAPPALVFATGLRLKGAEFSRGDQANLYTIAITDQAILGDRERLAAAANTAHEMMMRANPREIAGYLRRREVGSVLSSIAHIAAELRDQILKLKPKLGLPGGVSIQVG
ncbi:MAG TPA: hypothetical protein VGM69_01805 [Chloroflexota bacterium]